MFNFYDFKIYFIYTYVFVSVWVNATYIQVPTRSTKSYWVTWSELETIGKPWQVPGTELEFCGREASTPIFPAQPQAHMEVRR